MELLLTWHSEQIMRIAVDERQDYPISQILAFTGFKQIRFLVMQHISERVYRLGPYISASVKTDLRVDGAGEFDNIVLLSNGV